MIGIANEWTGFWPNALGELLANMVVVGLAVAGYFIRQRIERSRKNRELIEARRALVLAITQNALEADRGLKAMEKVKRVPALRLTADVWEAYRARFMDLASSVHERTEFAHFFELVTMGRRTLEGGSADVPRARYVLGELRDKGRSLIRLYGGPQDENTMARALLDLYDPETGRLGRIGTEEPQEAPTSHSKP